MIKFNSSSPEETESFGEQLAALLKSGDLLCCKGGLGSGKTALARGIARGLHSKAFVSSPTFAIMNEYKGGRLTLYHFDMYRIESEDDLYSTGFYDYLSAPDSAIFIEWSENIESFLPLPRITVSFFAPSETEREITVTGDDRF